MERILNENSPETDNTQNYKPAHQTPKRSQQEIMLAFHSSQRKQLIQESRQKISILVQLKQAKVDQFIVLMYKLREEPSDLRYQQMVEYYNNEQEDIKDFTISFTRQLIIERIYHRVPPVVNKILLFLIELEFNEEDLILVSALFNIFYKIKDQECHVNCLRLLKRIFKRNLELVAQMEDKEIIFVDILCINIGNSPKLLKLLSQICLIFYNEGIVLQLLTFKDKIGQIFEKAVESRDLKIINGILFLLNALEKVDRQDVINQQAFQINKICKEKFDQSDYELCDSLFETLLFCSHSSSNLKSVFLDTYMQILYQIDDVDLGTYGVQMLLDELQDVYSKGIDQNVAKQHINVLMNVSLMANEKGFMSRLIKQEIKDMIESLILIPRQDDEFQIEANQDDNQSLDKIYLLYNCFNQLL